MGQIVRHKNKITGKIEYPVTVSDAVLLNGKTLTKAHDEKADKSEIDRIDKECVKAREVGETDFSQGGNVVVVEDNLVSTNKNTALSANQGRVLKQMIENIPQGGGGGSTTIVDNLTSTSTTSALSANQGKVLKDMIDGKQAAITSTNKLSYSLISGAPSVYTKSEIDTMIGNIETLLAAL